AERMKLTSSTIAPDATVLAKAGSPVAYPSLLVLNAGDELAGGATALGRRCQLPWGEYGFNAANLNSNGQSLARRAIEWAAGAEAVANGSGGVVFQNYADQKSGVIGSTSTAINTPTGTNEGDLLVAVVAADGNDPIAPPAGWNQIAMSVSSNRVAMGVWWKLASNNEAAAHTFTWAPSNEQSFGWIMRFTGHDPTNPIHASAVDTGPSGSPVNPAVSTSVNNCMILRIGGFDDDDVSVGDTGLAGHTTINMDKSHSGHGTVSGGAGYIVQPSAGSSGVANFSLGGPEEYVTVTIAIAPNPTP
ncbi:MAG: hypothetical protein MI725_00415, partial [Pirellulales bacterium]|nr:hypothetical protein [Pirellulales bacterium]